MKDYCIVRIHDEDGNYEGGNMVTSSEGTLTASEITAVPLLLLDEDEADWFLSIQLLERLRVWLDGPKVTEIEIFVGHET